MKDVLEVIEIKMSEQEMFKIIAEIDPDNTGYLGFGSFKHKMAEKEI